MPLIITIMKHIRKLTKNHDSYYNVFIRILHVCNLNNNLLKRLSLRCIFLLITCKNYLRKWSYLFWPFFKIIWTVLTKQFSSGQFEGSPLSYHRGGGKERALKPFLTVFPRGSVRWPYWQSLSRGLTRSVIRGERSNRFTFDFYICCFIFFCYVWKVVCLGKWNSPILSPLLTCNVNINSNVSINVCPRIVRNYRGVQVTVELSGAQNSVELQFQRYSKHIHITFSIVLNKCVFIPTSIQKNTVITFANKAVICAWVHSFCSQYIKIENFFSS